MKSDANSRIVKLTPIPGITLTNVPNPVRVHDELIRPANGPANPMPCPSFLIEHEHGTVLFDAGISPRGLADPTGAFFGGLAERWGFELNPSFGIDTQLTRLGKRLTDIQFVIMSHLHYEHVGGAYLFPNATFIVGAREFDYAYNTAGVKRSLFLPNDIEPIRGFRWVETDNDMDLFGDGSVRILQAPGHTPGSLAVAVRSQAGSFIISGDACHHRIEVETGIPCGMPDTLTATKSLRRLILLSRTWRAPIWVQHSQHHWDEYSALCATSEV